MKMRAKCSRCGSYTIDKHISAMRKYVDYVRKNETPAQSREVLILTGILEEDGKTIAKRHRMEMAK